MRIALRFIGVLSLLALLTSANFLYAQENDITVVGSAIVEPLFRSLTDASGSEANVSIDITGTNTGFSQFCAGEADIALANREISTSESTNCENQGIEFIELLIGHNIVAVVANPAADFAQCLDADQLNTIFAPSTTGDITNWNQVLEEGPDTPLSVYIPDELSPVYAIMNNLIEGDGLRADATTESDAAAILSAVSENEGALGLVNLKEVTDAVQVVELDAGDIPGCQPPTAQNAEDNLYPAADKLYA
ncbi:MAG: substrate-binding domain-containing protein, partial [Anaerolineae bacterium]|nr:substrate-binding domain-containing protein [Anaerolineae bacterium]